MLCRNRGQGQRTGSPAETRPDGIAAIHRGTAARHPIETGQGGVVARAAAFAWSRNCQNAARERSFYPAETKSMQAPLKQSLMALQPCTGTGYSSGTGMRICGKSSKNLSGKAQAGLSSREADFRPAEEHRPCDFCRRKAGRSGGGRNSSPNRERDPKAQYTAGIGKRGLARWEPLKCVRPVRAGAAAGSRRLRRPHSIPPAAGPSCAAPACP